MVNAITGINDIQKNSGGKVFPDPATDIITYQTKRNSSVSEIRIIDITGKAVIILQKPAISDDQVKIHIDKLNKGIYFILVRSENEIESGKFLKS